MKRWRTWQRLKMLQRDHAAADLAGIVHQIEHQQRLLLQIETAMQRWTDSDQDAKAPAQQSLTSSGSHTARQLALEWWLQSSHQLQQLEAQQTDAATQLLAAQRQADAAQQKIEQLQREERSQEEAANQRSMEELVLARRVHSTFHR